MAAGPTYSIVLHAGAAESWFGDANTKQQTENFLNSVIAKAEVSLRAGCTAVDVATEAVACLEDYPDFNAGKGSALNLDGFHELEAAVVEGQTSEYRAVAGLRRTRNPVRLARAMLSRTSPAFIFGKTGDRLAEKMGLQMVPNRYFTTPKRLEYWSANVENAMALEEDHGTAGAVVLDSHGNLAAANTTGGMTFKLSGRIGDTAVLGAGIWADEHVAIACSGTGEAILKSSTAARIVAEFGSGKTLDNSIRHVLLESAAKFPRASCGVIAVSADGTISIQSNSRLFTVASSTSQGSKFSAITPATISSLKQHLVYTDDMMSIGIAKYPTMKNQISIELQQMCRLQNMDLSTFSCFFGKLCSVACAALDVLGPGNFGFATSDGRRAFLFHIRSEASGANLANVKTEVSETDPIWMTCPESSMVRYDVKTKSSEGHKSDDEHCFVEAVNELTDDESSTKLFVTKSGGMLSTLRIVSKYPLAAGDTFTSRNESNSLITKSWRALRMLSVRFGIPLDFFGFQLLPIQGRLTVIITRTDSITLRFPAPAIFCNNYSEFLSTEYGPLPSDLNTFASSAKSIKRRLELASA